VPNKIKPKRSYTANAVPTTSDLDTNELAIRWDASSPAMFTKNAAGNIVSITLGGSGGGSIVTAASVSAFPASGSASNLYITSEDQRIWRWDATASIYVESGPIGGSGLTWSSVPASASATGTAGQIAYDANYQYICVATNTWIRKTIGAWDVTSPTQLSNLALWLDASDSASVTTVSGNVSQWSDKSGNANHVTQSTSGSRPPYQTSQVNGLNAIYFGGLSATHRLIRSSFSVSAPSVFTVFRMASGFNASDEYAKVIFDTISGNRCVLAVESGSPVFNRNDVSGSKATTASALANNRAYVSACVSDETGHQIWLNGVKGTDATAGTAGFNGISIGNLRGDPDPVAAGYSHYGHICEVIVYSSKKTDAERAGIEAYLTKKWGII
jgi:hypothetical protein